VGAADDEHAAELRDAPDVIAKDRDGFDIDSPAILFTDDWLAVLAASHLFAEATDEPSPGDSAAPRSLDAHAPSAIS
jgi:hypothetical protein